MTGKKDSKELLHKYSFHITIGIHLLILIIFVILRLEKGFNINSKKYIIQFEKEDKSTFENLDDNIKNNALNQATNELKDIYSTLPESEDVVTNLDQTLNEISTTIEQKQSEDKHAIIIDKSPIPTIKNLTNNIKNTPENTSSTKSRISLISINLDQRVRIFSEIPIFKCKSGGKVLVDIKVNRQGGVIDAKVVKIENVSICIQKAAYNAAINTVFNTDIKAPKVQHGNIVYLFIKQ